MIEILTKFITKENVVVREIIYLLNELDGYKKELLEIIKITNADTSILEILLEDIEVFIAYLIDLKVVK